MLQFLREHFTHVAPVLFMGALGVAIILDRLRALFLVYPMHDKKQFFDRLQAFIMADRLKDAVALCNMHQHKPVVQVVREGLIRAHQPEEMVADGLAMAVSDATHAITKRTAYLATIANVATLLGLVGTIAGLIQSFEAVGRADPSQKAALLASGISTAMNATLLGLGVAVPCMIFFSLLMNKTNNLTTELNQSAIKTMDLLRQRLYSGNASTRKSA